MRTTVLLFTTFLLLYFLFRSKSVPISRAGIPLAILTTGFAGMIFDLLLIFAFQSIYGHVFSWIGLLVASFMAGAACGATFITRVLARTGNSFKLFIGTELAIICFSIACPFVFLAVREYTASPGAITLKMFFLVLSFVCGLLIGSQFPLANKIVPSNSSSSSSTAGYLYASDLLGGWFGGLIGAVVLLPVLGLVGTCITVVLLKVASLMVLTTQPSRHL